MIRVFVSSVQREFAEERQLLCKYIRLRDYEHIVDTETHIVDTETHIADAKTHIADVKLTKKQMSVIEFCETPKTGREIVAFLGIVYQARAVKRYITDLVAAGLLLPLVMGKPNSPNQKYVSAQAAK